jgi:uncharacterized protein (TIGR03435 family)
MILMKNDMTVRTLVRRGLYAAGCAILAITMVQAPLSRAQATAPPRTIQPESDTHAKGDISGDWQGTLEPPQGKALRLILRITKSDNRWSAKFYSIDQPGQAINVTSVKFDGSSIICDVTQIGGTYEGKLSADGNTLAGSFTQGNPLPLTLVRASKETAWEIPPPPAPPKLMAADANPSFDVATIKPNNSGGSSMQGLNVNGRNFTTRNSSLGDLIAFAYNVHAKQIVGGPDWLDKDRFDIAAVPVEDGAPSPEQLRIMIRKLMADRFKLTFHHEKRELPAFVLTVSKPSDRLIPNTSGGPLPGLGFGPGKGGLTFRMGNATIGDFTGLLQILVLDRPVVDQTGITGKYDMNFTFTPDDSLFNGHPPQIKQAEGVEAAPGFFDALQQQVGLKLTPEKTQVDVIAIDHVEKYSSN